MTVKLCFDQIHQKREFIFHLNTEDSCKTSKSFESEKNVMLRWNVNQIKNVLTRGFIVGPGLTLSPNMLQAPCWWGTPWTYTLFYEGFISHVPTSILQVVWPMGILLSNDWQEVSLCKGTHLIKRLLDVICCKRRQQGSWNSMIHFHWRGHTLSPFFLSNLSVFWMKDFNFLKVRAGFAPLLLFLYDS